MSHITVRAATYWRYLPPCFGAGAPLAQACQALADGIAGQAVQALRHLPADWSPTDLVVCSTIVSSMLTEVDGEHARGFKARLQAKLRAQVPPTAAVPALVVNAYECASWGYVLRHCARQPGRRRVLLAIADLDVHQFDHWTQADIWRNLWGHTGFGVTVLCLELDPQTPGALLLSPGSGANSVMDFARHVKALCTAAPDALLCQPFFPAKTQEMFAKLVGLSDPMDGLHAQWGHCFGSDPWIALITHRLAHPRPARDDAAVVASLAFNGYSAAARVTLAAQAHVDLQDRPVLLPQTLPPTAGASHAPALPTPLTGPTHALI